METEPEYGQPKPEQPEQPQPQPPPVPQRSLIHLIDPQGIHPGQNAEAGMWNCLIVARAALETLGVRVIDAQSCTDPKTKLTADIFSQLMPPAVKLLYDSVEFAIQQIEGPQIIMPDHNIVVPDHEPTDGKGVILP